MPGMDLGDGEAAVKTGDKIPDFKGFVIWLWETDNMWTKNKYTVCSAAVCTMKNNKTEHGGEQWSSIGWLGVVSLAQGQLSRKDADEGSGQVAVGGKASRQRKQQMQGPDTEPACYAQGTARSPVWLGHRVLKRGCGWRWRQGGNWGCIIEGLYTCWGPWIYSEMRSHWDSERGLMWSDCHFWMFTLVA